MEEFLTHIDIDTPVGTAWQVLTDFNSYPAWNPVSRRVDGPCEAGAALTLHLAKDNQGDETFSVRVKLVAKDTDCELAWRGGAPGMPFLVDVVHAFRLQSTGQNSTRLEHYEVFKGLLIPIVGRKLRATLPARYAAYNTAFKERCESVQGTS